MTYTNILNNAKYLKTDGGKLTDFEALQIACKIEQVEAFKKAFMVPENSEDLTPVALEAMAMALGMKPLDGSEGSME